MKEYQSIVASSVGSSHLKTNKPCQDRVMSFSSWSHKGIVVCDGHGAAKHFRSAIGAEFATNACRDSVGVLAKYLYKTKKTISYVDKLEDLEKSIVTKWNLKVLEHVELNPFTKQELDSLTNKEMEEVQNNPHIAYGSTLLFAFICKEHLFVSQLGDGDCRLLTKNGFVEPLLEDERLKYGKTTSLCSSNAMAYIRHAVLDVNNIRACSLSSDGVKNSFDSERNFINFLKTVVKIERSTGVQKARNDLNAFLPQLSKRGSGDDVSIGILL